MSASGERVFGSSGFVASMKDEWLSQQEEHENDPNEKDKNKFEKKSETKNEEILEEIVKVMKDFGMKEDETEEQKEVGSELNGRKKLMELENFEIGPEVLNNLLFREELEIMHYANPGQAIGSFSVGIVLTDTEDPLSMIVHVSGRALLYSCFECSTSITSCVTSNLFTIDEKRYEYTYLDDFSKKQQMYLACEGADYHISTQLHLKAQPVEKIIRKIPIRNCKKLVSEGANILLLRWMAITGFEGLLEADAILSDGTVCPTRYICKRGSREDEPVLVVTREVYESPNSKQILSSTLSRAGYLLQHTWMEGEYIVKVSPYKKVREGCVEKAVPLECVWEDDMELASKYLDCETQHRASHRSYLADHPEVRALLKDFMQATLLLKPSNVLSFATDFFGRFTFAQEYEPGPSTQLTTSLLDEVLGLVVRLAGRREVAAILETLLQRVLRRELDRNLLALLRDLCSSTTRLADILHAVIVVLEREGQVACVLSSLLIAAVPSGGEREMAELLADIVPHDVVEIVLKDILNSATTTTEYDIVKDKVTTATTRPDHDIIVDILQDILTTATAGAGHDVKVDILKEILTTINEGTRAEDNILQDLPEDEILQQDTAEDKTN